MAKAKGESQVGDEKSEQKEKQCMGNVRTQEKLDFSVGKIY